MSWSSLCKPSSGFRHGAGASPVPAVTSVIAGMSLKASRDAAVKGLLCQNSQGGSSWPLRQVPQDRWAPLDQRSEPALGGDPSIRRGPLHRAVSPPPDRDPFHQAGSSPSDGIPSIRQGSSPSDRDPLHQAGTLSIGQYPLHPAGSSPLSGIFSHQAGTQFEVRSLPETAVRGRPPPLMPPSVLGCDPAPPVR